MKKIYILALAMGAISFSSFGQIDLTDDMESYNLGPISPQADQWRTWSGVSNNGEDGDVTTEQANSGSKSMKIGVGPGPQDQLLLIDAQTTTDIYTVQWAMYIPSGNEGYFNAQGVITEPQAQALFGGNVFWNQDGLDPGVGLADGPDPQNFTFSHDVWMTVRCEYDVVGQTWDMYIDNVAKIVDKGWEFNAATQPYLGGIDYYAASTATTFYVDDVVLALGVLGADDFSADVFSVYPNPVKDVLNISSKAAVDAITVYDILGKVVLTARPDAISPSIDMSNLSSGAYLVKVTIGNGSKTVKVIK